jgi:hypothetical protein
MPLVNSSDFARFCQIPPARRNASDGESQRPLVYNGEDGFPVSPALSFVFEQGSEIGIAEFVGDGSGK